MNDIDKIISNSYENLDKTLTKGYFSKYGVDLIITFIIVIIFIIAFLYYYFSNIIRNKLSNYQCSPINIPFMNILNYNNKNSFLDKSQANFNQCVKKSLKPVLEKSIKPQNKSLNIVENTYSDIKTSNNYIASVFNKVRNNITDNTNDIYNRINSDVSQNDKQLNDIKNNLYESNTKIQKSMNISQDLNKSLNSLSKTLEPLKIVDKPSWIKEYQNI